MNKYIIIDNFSAYLFHLKLDIKKRDGMGMRFDDRIDGYRLNQKYFIEKNGLSKKSKFHYAILEREGLISIVCT